MSSQGMPATPPPFGRVGTLELPTDAEISAVAEGLLGDEERLLLGGLAIAVLDPLQENRYVAIPPSYQDAGHPIKALQSSGVRKVSTLLTYRPAGRSYAGARERWAFARKEWERHSGESVPPDLVVLSNPDGRVSRGTAVLARVIVRDNMPTAVWKPPVASSGAQMVRELPVLDQNPRRAAALVRILRQRGQE